MILNLGSRFKEKNNKALDQSPKYKKTKKEEIKNKRKMNKKGLVYVGKKALWIFLALSLLTLIFYMQYTSAAVQEGTKADQFTFSNRTCEEYADVILWSAVGTKGDDDTSYYYNWSMSYDAPTNKTKNIINISADVRHMHVGAGADLIGPGGGYIRIANKTESPLDEGALRDVPPTSWDNIRYLTYLNVTLNPGDILRQWECGIKIVHSSMNSV